MLNTRLVKQFLGLSVVTGTLLLATTSANAVLVFSDNFELPNVGTTGYTTTNGVPGTSAQRDTTKWVGANQGFGATANGIIDEGTGWFSDPNGEQAYAFRYTNSGVTSAEGAIGALMAGTYNLTFDVVRDAIPGDPTVATPYSVQLIAFNSGVARNDVRSTPAGATVLASRSGNALTDFSWSTVSLQLNVLPGNLNIGRDLAIRFIGATSSAIIDDVALDGPSAAIIVPEPATASLALMGLGGLMLRRRLRA